MVKGNQRSGLRGCPTIRKTLHYNKLTHQFGLLGIDGVAELE